LPRERLDVVQAVEDHADECWRALEIVRNPSNVAVWAFLTGGIASVEREQGARGSNTPHFDAMLGNLIFRRTVGGSARLAVRSTRRARRNAGARAALSPSQPAR